MDTKKRFLQNSKNLFFSIVYNKQISINLNKKKLNEIIGVLLSSGFNLNTYGYNSGDNEYWGKKINKEECYLYFNIKIYETNMSVCKILISSLIGSYKEFNNFVNAFYKRIYAYNKHIC
jgi:hypothetical protein